MELRGEVGDIIYQNEVNSYLIASFEMEQELTTIVGYLPFVNKGDYLKITGDFVEHKDYGTQFKVLTFEKIMPKTPEAIEKYLAGGIVKGIGPATARKIVSTFGEETVHVFKYEPQKLSQIKGITKEKALEMGQSFCENWELWQIVGFLEKFGIGAQNAKKVYNLLGVNAIEEIEANPYLLIDITRGVDFKQIDKMAMDLGIVFNDDRRIKSGIKYALLRVTYNGHSCTLKQNLIMFVSELLNVKEEEIENSIINLKATNEIVVEKREDEEWVYLYPFYKAELDIAERIQILDKSKNVKAIKNINVEIRKQEKLSDIELSKKQIDAIKAVNDNNVCIITGGPGTGKTTIIKTIIDIYEAHGNKIVLCAPTRKSSKKND